MRDEKGCPLEICGQKAVELRLTLEGRLKKRLDAKVYTLEEVGYIKEANFSPIEGILTVSDFELRTLRRLCQSFDVELRELDITSHRKVIGPLIVAVKKAFLPILRALLRDVLKQQRDFNAAAVTVLGQLISQRNSPMK